MKNLIKQLSSFILPITVLILVPLCIERSITIYFGIPLVLGLVIITIGLIIIVMTIRTFIRTGKGYREQSHINSNF